MEKLVKKTLLELLRKSSISGLKVTERAHAEFRETNAICAGVRADMADASGRLNGIRDAIAVLGLGSPSRSMEEDIFLSSERKALYLLLAVSNRAGV